MRGTFQQYSDQPSVPLEGYFTAPAGANPHPGVLIGPSWLNVREGICRRADRIAELGYAVFVADLFGAGVRPGPPQSPMEVVEPLLRDRLQLRRRLLAALSTLQSRPECDRERVAALGYCVGGSAVLELARAGASLRGVISIHGFLDAPVPASPGSVVGKILILHGDADPTAGPDRVAEFCREMRAARANWELDIYGEARHAFTGEGILDQETAEAGVHQQSEARAWRSTVGFLREVLE